MRSKPATKPSGPVRVLLLEDHLPDAALVQEHLRASPVAEFAVEHVERLADALTALLREEPDLVLCDLQLPDGQGLEVVARLRELAPLVPLIVLTGTLGAGGHTALRAGASAFLMKAELEPSVLAETALLTHLRQQALRRALDLIEQCSDGVLVLDEDARVRYTNPAAAALLQLAPKALFGEPLPVELGTTAEHVRLDGTVAYLRAAAATTQWAGQPAQLVTLRDVTEQVEREARARAAERLEAIGRLAGGVAHDFNNMLTVISGNARTIRSTLPKTDPRHQALGTILDAGARAEDMVRSLLTFAGRRELRPETFDLNVVLSSLSGLLGSLIGDEVELQLDLGEEDMRVHVDQGQLAQAVVNLVSNANHAMPRGGSLVLATARAGDLVQLRVQDTGVGMSEEVRARIFEPFFSTRELGEGTGLGLAGVRGFVSQSNGRVRCESAPGQGTTFELELPAAEAASEPAQSTRASASRRQEGERGRLLLVEDEFMVADILRDTLASEGFEVVLARDGHEALGKLAEGPVPDLVLTDLSMRGMSGTDLADAVREQHPELKVAFMSGYAASELDPESPWARAPFLQKPFTPSALAAFLDELLA